MQTEPSVYDSAGGGRGGSRRPHDLWRYRGLVHELVIRDIKVRYKRSVLGILWTMLAPLLNMIALTLVFSALLKTAIENYPVYFMAGQIFWSFFSQTTTAAASQTQASNDLAKRTFIPRSVFVASAVGGGLVNLAAVAPAPPPDPRGHRVSAPRDLGVPAGLDLHQTLFTAGASLHPLHGHVALRRRREMYPCHGPDVVLPDADRLPPVDRAAPVPRSSCRSTRCTT